MFGFFKYIKKPLKPRQRFIPVTEPVKQPEPSKEPEIGCIALSILADLEFFPEKWKISLGGHIYQFDFFLKKTKKPHYYLTVDTDSYPYNSIILNNIYSISFNSDEKIALHKATDKILNLQRARNDEILRIKDEKKLKKLFPECFKDKEPEFPSNIDVPESKSTYFKKELTRRLQNQKS